MRFIVDVTVDPEPSEPVGSYERRETETKMADQLLDWLCGDGAGPSPEWVQSFDSVDPS